MRRHGVTEHSIRRMVFDAGVVYRNFVSPEEPGELIGATRGGTEFSSGIDVRKMSADGVPGGIKGWQRTLRVVPTLTVNMLEITKENFLAAVTGSVLENTEIPTKKRIKLKQISDSSYLQNIAFVGSGKKVGNVIIRLNNVITEGDLTMMFRNNDELNPAVTFTGHWDAGQYSINGMEAAPVEVWLWQSPQPGEYWFKPVQYEEVN